jgi:hypothetical protein
MKINTCSRSITFEPTGIGAAAQLRIHRQIYLALCLIAGGAATYATQAAPSEAGDTDAVAISSKVSSDYTRTRLADGSLQSETFTYGNGGVWRSGEAGSTEELNFMDVAKTVAGPLASQNYLASRDPKGTRLLIMVYWGKTRTPEHSTDSGASQNLEIASAAALAANHAQIARFSPNDSCAPQTMAQSSTTGYAIRSPDQIDIDNAMTGAMAMVAAEDSQRSQLNTENANMLGYDSWWAETAQFKGTPLEYRQKDMFNELEAGRYFVVLMDYDFQMMWKDRKAKLLWETRFSIRDKGEDFSKQLAGMAASASQYFGRSSGKLVHKTLPEGHVDVGTIKTLAFDQK